MGCSQNHGPPFGLKFLLRHLIFKGTKKWDPNFENSSCGFEVYGLKAEDSAFWRLVENKGV